jgi:hypothetical protein
MYLARLAPYMQHWCGGNSYNALGSGTMQSSNAQLSRLCASKCADMPMYRVSSILSGGRALGTVKEKL